MGQGGGLVGAVCLPQAHRDPRTAIRDSVCSRRPGRKTKGAQAGLESQEGGMPRAGPECQMRRERLEMLGTCLGAKSVFSQTAGRTINDPLDQVLGPVTSASQWASKKKENKLPLRSKIKIFICHLAKPLTVWRGEHFVQLHCDGTWGHFLPAFLCFSWLGCLGK